MWRNADAEAAAGSHIGVSKAGGRAVADSGASAGAPARSGPVYAALDLGTTNCRLLIAKPEAEGFRVIDSFSRTVRLGEGMAETNTLSEAAMRRAVEAVKVCAQKMQKAGVTRARAIATAACRSAKNGKECIALIKSETGIDFEIVTAQEEARLAVAGSAPLLDRACKSAVVFDIGGGSTELIWLRLENAGPPQIAAWVSAPIGVVTLAERHGRSQLPASAYTAMEKEALSIFQSVGAPKLDAIGFDGNTMHMLGTSGTVTTIAAIHQQLRRYDRAKVDGIWLALADATGVVARLSKLDYDSRVAEPCVGTDRADLVLSGCAIFSAIATLWPCERLRIADRGLREGILLALMNQANRRARHRRRRRGRGGKKRTANKS